METTVENKEYFSTIIDAMTDLIRVVDEEGRILMINAAMQEVAGSCLGKQCFECLGESSPCPDCVLKACSKAAGSPVQREPSAGDAIP